MSNNQLPYFQARIITLAQTLVRENALILDTETTGLGYKDEIVEICIIDMTGEAILNTLVKPTILMPPSASAVHGIVNEQLSEAPYITALLPKLVNLLKGRSLAIYNAPFDLRLLRQSLKAHGDATSEVLSISV